MAKLLLRGAYRKEIANFMAYLIIIILFSSTILIIFIQASTSDPSNSIFVGSNKIGENKLSLGCQIDELGVREFRDSPTRQQIVKDANIKIIRIFDWRDWEEITNDTDPCIYWTDYTKEGRFNWTNIDQLVQKIFEVGAEPIFCLGGYSHNEKSCEKHIPTGMDIDWTLDYPYLPNAESWAAYCKEWVKHFNEVGLPVKYYQIWNEPFTIVFDDWGDYNQNRMQKFFNLYNLTYNEMKSENPNILIGNDCSTFKGFLHYWLDNSGTFDFLSFHKYDVFTADISNYRYYNDTEMFRRSELYRMETSDEFELYYGISDAKKIWENTTGKQIPIIISEFNFSSSWNNGTDPRIQQMSGAIWTALVLRKAILEGVDKTVYYTLASNATRFSLLNTGGYGFGLVDSTTEEVWYPYYVHQLIGKNLNTSNTLYETTVTNFDVQTLAWINEKVIHLLIINKSNSTLNLEINFENNYEPLRIQWIDESNQKIQNQSNPESEIELNGYTVMLFTAIEPVIPVPEFPSGLVLSTMIIVPLVVIIYRKRMRR